MILKRFCLTILATSAAARAAAFTPPSWEQLQSPQSPLHRPLQYPSPIYTTKELPTDVKSANKLPILYRDQACICVASEIVWLAMECKNVEYLTVLVSKDEDDGIPRIVWPESNENDGESITNDPIVLLEQIQARYPTNEPAFYPKISISVDASRSNIMRLPGVMPRNSDPDLMSASPFLFRKDGTMVAKSSHCVSIEELEEMMEEYDSGLYICGKDLTAADLVWISYMERYAAQLPLIFPKVDVLNPRSSSYELVAEWCKAVERNVPAYACRVMGDARHWRGCLEQSVEVHNARAQDGEAVDKLAPIPKRKRWWLKSNPRSQELWKDYVCGDGKLIRPWMADTPEQEAGLYLLKNRDRIMTAFAAASNGSTEAADEALREIVQQLIQWHPREEGDECDKTASSNAKTLLEVLVHSIQVPIDLGMVPAVALGELLVKMEADVET